MRRLSRRTVLKGIGIAGAAGLVGSNAMAATPDDDARTDWPVSRGTNARTGYTQGSGPGPYAGPGWSPGDELNDPTEVTVVDGTAYIGTVGSFDFDVSTGQVAAYDATGDGVRWIREGDSFGAVQAAPSVADGRVFVVTRPATIYTAGGRQGETPPNGGILALDADSGETLWTNQSILTMSEAVLVRDGTVYAFSGAMVYALSTESGEEQWSAEVTTTNSVRTLALGEETLYAATPQTVAAIGLDGTVEWETDAPEGIEANTLAAGDEHLYLTMTSSGDTDADTVWALSPDDGSVVWETQVAANFKDSTPNDLSAPAVADDVVYVASEDSNSSDSEDDERVGALHALSAESGDELWQFTTAAKLVGTPAVTEDTIYVGGQYTTNAAVENERDAGYFEHGADYVDTAYARPAVYALNREDGTVQWSYGIEDGGADYFALSTVPANDHLYVQVSGTRNPPYGAVGAMYALESSENKPGKEHQLVDDTPREPEEEPVSAVITSDPENADELDFDSGATVTLSGSDSSSPTGGIVSYEWDIDADGEYEKTGETIDVELDYCGVLEVTLKVTDEAGQTATESISLSTV
ncbi:PQQ-binding-like beta-propeller repeat protein [Haladaptatus sp. DYSN1]|uniref:outer membrane protein assembly factor BamB family protein n=1 Tax=unclassified Haladaptatus TaxID=2622732 RepID=UPI0024059DF0|nr:PQQ-binding-like beta-propeller repeat protein [Haladaptatus sp. DYSN1]